MNRWGDPRFRPVRLPERYAEAASGAVAYRPVARGGEPLGFLWASDVDGAAGWVECGAAGPDGWNAGTPWLRRLASAKAAGRTPGEALRHLADLPEDERAGVVSGPEAGAASLAELTERAGPLELPGPPQLAEPAPPPGPPPAGLNSLQRAAYDYTRAPDVHNALSQADDPPARLAELLADPARAAALAAIFGRAPLYGDFVERFRLLDQAVRAPLPQSLETLRGVDDVAHLTGGVADLRAAAGGTYTEPGYLSVSLGATPAYRTGCWLRLVAPKGTPALWMGRRSHHPDERELILPRALTIRIDDVYLRDGHLEVAATIVTARHA
ncbi:ADP-ribosyltransferase [Phytohabitans sp. ZYX-F-186]|uniref:ADP-ribosyltransferase n=1 Tax=Phytohabitans maris TaxID=3071409 RepID=A0ABU0ZHM7_9ACTN|nr:ADP-ribosyltransferase [Phytohabitans sp. ZYX-F-186]MDQ7906558.1 ADP-ribosyltransferase [Phytohabitans sp. ZYX-F-186]